MRVLASRKGFSLVELLTVIAIIALLAGIIFPVLALVQKKAQMTKCMTQMHEIGLAVQVFKQDNRKYPDILGTVVKRDTSNRVVPIDQATSTSGTPPAGTPTGLFPEYIKSARLLHCPGSKNLDTSQVVTAMPSLYDPMGDGNGIETYAYNSYDFMIYGSAAGSNPDLRQHYTKSWAKTVGDVPSVSTAPSDPQADYERQLKFRTPPDNTVITWCSWHETVSNSGTSLQVSGKAPTLFLDGHVDALEATDVESQRWRVLPKKE